METGLTKYIEMGYALLIIVFFFLLLVKIVQNNVGVYSKYLKQIKLTTNSLTRTSQCLDNQVSVV